MNGPDALLDRVAAWVAEDPDPETRAELEELVQAGDMAALAQRFDGGLEFGTAGLRGPLGAGPTRMNRVVVRRTAAGLARWLQASPGRVAAGVAVGYDARRKSDVFAADTAAVLAAAGVDVHLLPRALPTPVLAHVTRRLGCGAGVMVTASHNPSGDNGYKVYLGDGAQIVPPVDVDIAAAIDAAAAAGPAALAGPADIRVHRLGDDVVDAYVAAAAAQTFVPTARSVRIAYTPLHGVGGAVALEVFARAGFAAPVVVTAQFEPDPDFPTVAFPNPEEPGALDLAMATATEAGADLVLAHDPDADRLGVAVPRRDHGGWQALRGDEIGALLADHVLHHTRGDDRLLATTVVSSGLLDRMGATAGVHVVRTLTGFKWIARAAADHPDLRFVFGYEEALGYCVGTAVRDKDGLSAAVVFAELVAALAAEGRTVHDRLDDLARAHGAHVTHQWSLRADGDDGLARIRAAMARLRARPPAQLAWRPVTAVEDLLAPGGGLPRSDVLILRLGDQARVIARPSGTEPKLKIYFEAVEPVTAADVPAAQARAAQTITDLRVAMSRSLAI